jgi:hypothetical protein
VLPVLTTDQKGALAEAEVAAAAARFGITVSRPMCDARYDLILDLPVGLLRVQCKWAQKEGEVIAVRCRTCRRGRDGLIHGGYRRGEIDAIAAFCLETDTCYLLPLAMSVNRAMVFLRLAPTRNNQTTGVNWAKDFEFAATLSALGPIAQLGER